MKKDNYSWWVNRVRHSLKIFDIVRIDHFRGFESYWAVPYGDENAKGGKWVKGPGYELFKTIEKELNIQGEFRIIAEDLGFLTPAVHKLLKKTGYPGMKILEFAFDPENDNDYMPYNILENSIVYPGTHDNMTIMGWYLEGINAASAAPERRKSLLVIMTKLPFRFCARAQKPRPTPLP